MRLPARFWVIVEMYFHQSGGKQEPDNCCYAFGHGMSRSSDLRRGSGLGMVAHSPACATTPPTRGPPLLLWREAVVYRRRYGGVAGTC